MNQTNPSRPATDAAVGSIAGSLRAVWRLVGGYWHGENKRDAWGLSLGLALVTLGHVLLQLRLNLWLGDFFNALDLRAGATIIRDLAVFALIALGVMAATAAQLRLKMAMQIGWRRWITRRLVDRWLADGHSYILHFRDGELDNPDYRIGEDVRLFTEGAVDFATGLLNSGLLLVIFLGVLWSLSGGAAITLGGVELAVPGYLVYVAVAYAGLSTVLTHLLGRRQIAIRGELHAREGDFRYDLVRVREDAENVAFLRGEANERRGLAQVFERLAATWRSLMGLQTRLAWVTTGFTVLTPVMPLVVAAPQFIAGTMSLGALIQASQAFVQVQLAMGFVIDNYARLSDWMAAIRRILQLAAAIDDVEREAATPGDRRIALRPSADGALRFVDLKVDGSDGTVVIDDASAAIQPGERVLVIGESGVGKTTLLRAIAGLWPWGSGTIELPGDKRMMFMLHRPYLPPGTLREALAYPEPPERFGAAELRAALTRCGLDRLVDRLDEAARWDEVMAEGERQRLAFARLLVHRPNWVLMDEATSELDDAAEADMMSLFKTELAGTTLISTGQRPSLAAFHDRTLTLARSPDGAHLIKGPPKPRRSVLGRRFLPW